MITLSHLDKSCEWTGKGWKPRQLILDAYEKENIEVNSAINANYHSSVGLSKEWAPNSVKSFIRDIIRSVVDLKIGDDEDIFMHGASSLSTASICSLIQLAISKSEKVPVPIIRSLSPKIISNFPTICRLSAFVYGALLIPPNVSPGMSIKDVGANGQPFDWKSLDPTSTVVTLRAGKGEPPLIILHGVAGSIIHFRPLLERFKSALWAIQITSETPLTSFAKQASFYYKKIKKELPTGPYRLASFSASSFLLVHLVLLFEENGDKVIQMAMLDHFPSTIIPVIRDFKNVDANDPDTRRLFLVRGFEIIDKQLRQDNSGLFPNQKEGADMIRDISAGKSANPAGKLRWEKMRGTLLQMLRFFSTLGITGTRTSTRTVEEVEISLIDWMKAVKAPVSVYVASNGMVDCIPEEVRSQWRELGVRETFPDAEIIHVKGSHFSILANDRVIESLQKGYHRKQSEGWITKGKL